MTLYYRDPFTANVSMVHKVREHLFGMDTPFQRVDFYDTEEFGVVMALGGVVNTSERDEMGYHDMIAHVPLFTHPAPKEVLIIGGGDGGTLRECVRHAGVERVTMVEIDEVVVNKCKEYLPSLACAFDHPKANLIIGDGLDHVKQHPNSYDVILVDSTDPVDAAVGLFQRPFYEDVRRALRPGGVFVPQSDSMIYSGGRTRDLWNTFRDLFEHVSPYLAHVPLYPGAMWTFMLCSQGPHPLKDFDPARVEASGMAFNYYNADIHRAAFALPTVFRRILEGETDPKAYWKTPIPREIREA